jgi:TetR/AcrR family transcriptional regulator
LAEKFLELTTVLEKGMAEGVVRSLDPFLTAINILGVCTFYFNARENLKYLDPTRQLLSAEAIEQQMQEAIDLIWAGIKA